ncbi:hypothetical protein Tco_0889199 [Tanacetum coccineum]
MHRGLNQATTNLYSFEQGHIVALVYLIITDNISYGCPNTTLDQIKEAAKIAQVHAFISSLVNGYDTQVLAKPDEDGDIGMGDSTGVSASLGGEIFSRGNKCQESNICDSDNTGGGCKIVGGAIGACGGIGERASEAKRSLVKSSEKLKEVFLDEAGKKLTNSKTVRNGVQDLLALGSWLLGTLEASLNLLLLLGNG